MTAALEDALDHDWRGAGDWDDMEVPVDPQERAELRRIAKVQARRAAQPKKPTHAWPQAEVDDMVRLWREGKTAQEISLIMGNRSRSAILGRLDRLGLKRGDAAETSKQCNALRRKATYKPKRGAKPRQSIGRGKGAVADSRRSVVPPASAEVIAFPVTADLIEEFDAFEPQDLHWMIDRFAA
ncbi:cell cycle regulator protein [Brevundimonas phage vB_BpoS-Marchewka]|uniref:Cell cycle regulator protein n=1 Tax=Brevundimonas phage vB_BpoS-Marchewka TaxID=2948604 RepID=A0A9E7N2Z2_9CAUD|nr:cell cycle regulator protein [Brevundimonas phage vB_BpoS-Marchewka]